MNYTLWRDLRGYFAVCNGPGPLEVDGYIFQRPNNTWAMENDELNRVFLDHVTAASAVLKRELPQGIHYYELKRGVETASIATYPEMLERLKADGWVKVSELRNMP